MNNSALKLLGDVVLIILLVNLVGYFGGLLFGFPFFDGIFDKFDYGLICGVVLTWIMQFKLFIDEWWFK